MRRVFFCYALGIGCWAAPARLEITLGKTADEDACSISKASVSFDARDRQVFARLLLFGVRPSSGGLHVEWIDPSGRATQTADFGDLPSRTRICVLIQMPIAGFPAADQIGRWTVRATADGRTTAEKGFAIVGSAAPVSIIKVDAGATADGKLQLDLTGNGFEPNSVVHVAQYTELQAWRYVTAELPLSVSPTTISTRTAPLGPGEYVVVVGTPQGAFSAPARLVISSGSGYKLPTPAGERWIVTQGPYGAFSHWNRSLHAWDIAPEAGRVVVAMRSGIAYTHDLGMGRTPGVRSFGNYVTIDHGDGEYSHYAHLETRSFLVRSGDRVEQGQPLALAGNSGYALGPGGGRHLHVHVTREPQISAQSIPFTFEDLSAGPSRRFTGPIMSANSPIVTAVVHKPAPTPTPRRRSTLEGSVEPAQWWSEVVTVPRRARSFEVELRWDQAGSDLDLHLVSPSGRHYGWYGEKQGYSGQRTNPERFTIDLPEPGYWRIAVQGASGTGAVAFEVQSHVEAGTRDGRRGD